MVSSHNKVSVKKVLTELFQPICHKQKFLSSLVVFLLGVTYDPRCIGDDFLYTRLELVQDRTHAGIGSVGITD